jgi:hypothetical protein
MWCEAKELKVKRGSVLSYIREEGQGVASEGVTSNVSLKVMGFKRGVLLPVNKALTA